MATAMMAMTTLPSDVVDMTVRQYHTMTCNTYYMSYI
ncbi:Hypothetical protein PFR_JS12-3_9 [Propionibacterium freudenreichii]|nr:Hypothetical protein PFR_JS12-3_9 [Propionibacterium freudenreichii]